MARQKTFSVQLAWLFGLAVCALPWLTKAGAQPPAPSARRFMLVVAHQDDDLGILDPDLRGPLLANRPIQTVYLTSGDAGFTCNAYTQARERGAKAAHAALSNVPNKWLDEERVVNGKRLRFSRLEGTQQTLVFFGFPNPALLALSPPAGSLQQLWSQSGYRLSTLPLDGRSAVDTYTKEQLIETLRALMASFVPDDVRTLDASQLQPLSYPFEHSDHVHAALFALTAMQRRAAANAFAMYRTYSVVFDPENLDAETTSSRRAVFDAYRAHDPKICDTGFVQVCGGLNVCDPYAIYLPFFSRNYSIDVVTRARAAIKGPGGLCLAVAGGQNTPTLGLCSAVNDPQQWSLEQGGRIRHLSSGACLAATSAALGAGLSLKACAQEPQQQFFLTSQGQLRGPEASCVRAFGQPSLASCCLDPLQLGWSAN